MEQRLSAPGITAAPGIETQNFSPFPSVGLLHLRNRVQMLPGGISSLPAATGKKFPYRPWPQAEGLPLNPETPADRPGFQGCR